MMRIVLKERKDVFARAAGLCLSVVLALSATAAPARQQSQPAPAATPAVQRASGDISENAKLVTEFEAGGLKVLLKRREGSQTVVAGLFLRGGSRNVTAENAGVEALMLDVATEASANFPREPSPSHLAREDSFCCVLHIRFSL